MRNRVLAGVLAAGVALVMAAPAESEAGHRRSSRGRSYGRSWHGRHYVRPHVSFAYRSPAPYVSYGYGSRAYYDYDPYYSDSYYSDSYYSDPYYGDRYYSYGYRPYYRPRPVFVPRLYYAPRPFYRGYRGRPHISIRLGF